MTTADLELKTLVPDIEADDHLGFLIHEVARTLTAAYGTAMKSLGLTRPQVRVVAYVDQYPGITQARLCECVNTSPMAMTGMIDRMEQKDLVRREDDPTDRRVKRIFLTSGALKLKPDMEKIAEEFRRQARKGVSNTEIDTLIKVLNKIQANVLDITRT